MSILTELQEVRIAYRLAADERDRYRKALEEIASQSLGHSADNFCVVVARKALEADDD